MCILVSSENQTLNDIGTYIIKKYPNIRFLFEIDFSKDDYEEIKKLFQNEYKFQDTYFKDEFFLNYFTINKTYRIPFLILLVGFIRYDYLNDENQANFFDNFLKHILLNDKADASDFRKKLISYFFRWRGKKDYNERGLYIYDTQTSDVSLKLEDSGKNKYLNSFIFHSGGVSEQDLKEYLKIIKHLSKEYTKNIQLSQLYKNKNFSVYSKKLDNLFSLLNNDVEISKYIEKFIKKSIETILNNQLSIDFVLPLYIRNYLLFTGKYGGDLEKVNINESGFIYENQSIVFAPSFHEIYRDIGKISFKVFDKIYNIEKENDTYTKDDFEKIKVYTDNISKMFTIELLIDDIFFRRYDINLFRHNFIILDNDFNIKNILNREINVPKRDEETKYYIVTKSFLDLKISDKRLDGYSIYELPLDMSIASINIENEEYKLIFSPTISSNIQYEDDTYKYTSELPKFRISTKDKDRFVAINLFNNDQLSYDEFYLYSETIGKFEIQINQYIFKVIFIAGFEIKKWFNWYDQNKILEIKVSDQKIKTNSDEIDDEDNGYIHSFKLKEQKNTIVFNQINGNYIHLELLKPIIIMSFLDKRKNETKIQSKNIKFARLDFFRQIKIQLSNYPNNIKFDSIEIGGKSFEISKHNNSYFLSIANIKEVSQQNEQNHLSIVLRNRYYFLPITDIIFDNVTVSQSGEKEIKIDDIHFLMNNSQNIKYYFNSKSYFIDGFETIETNGYTSEMLTLKEVRETKKSTVIRKNFKNIREDGLYVQLKDIDYE